MPYSLRDILDRADEFADRAERYEPSPDDETTTPEMLLRRAAWRRAQAEADIADAVLEARQGGLSWATIGAAIGTSAQAAQHRYAEVVATGTKSAAKPASRKSAAKSATSRKGAARSATGRISATKSATTTRKRAPNSTTSRKSVGRARKGGRSPASG
jgi:hypothetical protein